MLLPKDIPAALSAINAASVRGLPAEVRLVTSTAIFAASPPPPLLPRAFQRNSDA
jgi:hypothetical protein